MCYTNKKPWNIKSHIYLKIGSKTKLYLKNRESLFEYYEVIIWVWMWSIPITPERFYERFGQKWNEIKWSEIKASNWLLWWYSMNYYIMRNIVSLNWYHVLKTSISYQSWLKRSNDHVTGRDVTAKSINKFISCQYARWCNANNMSKVTCAIVF